MDFFSKFTPPPLLLENVDNLAFKNCPFKKNTDKFLFSISSTVANMILLHDMSLCLYITRGGGTHIGWSIRMLGRIGCAFGNFCSRKGMVWVSWFLSQSGYGSHSPVLSGVYLFRVSTPPSRGQYIHGGL